jgi:hypothetical protein
VCVCVCVFEPFFQNPHVRLHVPSVASKITINPEDKSLVQAAAAGNSRDGDEFYGYQLACFVEAVHEFSDHVYSLIQSIRQFYTTEKQIKKLRKSFMESSGRGDGSNRFKRKIANNWRCIEYAILHEVPRKWFVLTNYDRMEKKMANLAKGSRSESDSESAYEYESESESASESQSSTFNEIEVEELGSPIIISNYAIDFGAEVAESSDGDLAKKRTTESDPPSQRPTPEPKPTKLSKKPKRKKRKSRNTDTSEC